MGASRLSKERRRPHQGMKKRAECSVLWYWYGEGAREKARMLCGRRRQRSLKVQNIEEYRYGQITGKTG